MRKDSELFLKKLLEHREQIGEDSFEMNYVRFECIPNFKVVMYDILNDLIDNHCLTSNSGVTDLEGNIIIHLTLDGITYFENKREPDLSVTFNVSGGQVNISNDRGKIDACVGDGGMSGKSCFAQRLDKLIETMNLSREWREEPITIGYLSEFLGYESENILRQYYVTTLEPDRVFMEMIADRLGVNKLWLAKGAPVSMFEDGDGEQDLEKILLEVYKAEKIFFVIANEGVGNCLTIILKINDLKYKYYNHSFVFHAEGGGHGQNELMKVYKFIKNLVNVKNHNNQYIDYEAGYYFSEQELLNLKQGNMYPAAVRKIRKVKWHIMEDFLDICHRYHTCEQYLEWYQKDFVKSQEYIRNRLQNME